MSGGAKVAPGAAPLLNELAREQMKKRLLADIAMDMQVCGLEGLDPAEYVDGLLFEVERIAVGLQKGSGIPKWRHVCGSCAAPHIGVRHRVQVVRRRVRHVAPDGAQADEEE